MTAEKRQAAKEEAALKREAVQAEKKEKKKLAAKQLKKAATPQEKTCAEDDEDDQHTSGDESVATVDTPFMAPPKPHAKPANEWAYDSTRARDALSKSKKRQAGNTERAKERAADHANERIAAQVPWRFVSAPLHVLRHFVIF